MLLLAAGFFLSACDRDPPAQFEGGIFDDIGTHTAEVGPGKDGVVDAPGDVSTPDLALDMDLTADPDLDAQAGADMDAALADQGKDAPKDLGGDTLPDATTTTDGSSDGTMASSHTLLGELVSGATISTGGSYRLLSQVGHPMDTRVLSGGQYTLRLRAIATIQ